MCVCLHMCVQVHVHICTRMHVKAKGWQSVSSWLLSASFTEAGSFSQTQELTDDRAGLASLLAPRTPYLSLPRVGITSRSQCPLGIYVGAGIWTWFSMRSRQVPHSPAELSPHLLLLARSYIHGVSGQPLAFITQPSLTDKLASPTWSVTVPKERMPGEVGAT